MFSTTRPGKRRIPPMWHSAATGRHAARRPSRCRGRIDSRWDVVAGIRLNETHESKTTSDLTLPPFTPTEVYDAATASRDVVRPTETVGVSYRLWAEGGE